MYHAFVVLLQKQLRNLMRGADTLLVEIEYRARFGLLTGARDHGGVLLSAALLLYFVSELTTDNN
jgi:hypothetical protein